MARVVSQRSGPPYLLIIFVFLFVVSTAIAVLVYLELDKAQIALAEIKETEAKFASNPERKSSRVSGMLKAYDKAQAKHDSDSGSPKPESVVAQLVQTINTLVQQITGSPADGADVAIGRSEEAFLLTGRKAGLAEQVIALKEQLNDIQGKHMPAQAKRIKDAALALTDEQKKVADLTKVAEDLRANIRTNDIAIEGKLKAKQDDYEQRLDKVAKQSEERVDELNKRIAELTDDMEKVQLKVQELKIKIATLEVDPRNKQGKPGKDKLFRKTVAAIAEIEDDSELCYIDVGRQDHVRPGLTFSVYPSDKFGDETANKGSILVTSVLERVSICRITSSEKGNPIVKGDLLENIAFDPTKKFLFVVDGDFDLSGRLVPTPEGAAEVKALIGRYGGKVVDALTAQTDFVVLGVPPARPSKPTEDDPPQVERVRQDQKKIWDRYQSVKRLARARGIPILNQNRFIALTGYATPTRK